MLLTISAADYVCVGHSERTFCGICSV